MDLNVLEKALIRTVRDARALYQDGDTQGSLKLLHTEAIPMLACMVQAVEVDSVEMYEALTMPIGEGAEA